MVRNIDKFVEKLTNYSEEDRERIESAARWGEELHSGQKRASGSPYFIHPLQVAEIIVDLNLDADAVIGALLHDILEDTDVSRTEMQQLFGKEIENLVNGVTKISIVSAKTKSIQEAETIRKMLFAMVKDIRVILIKLADKLHNMRTLQYLPPEKRKVIARECLDIYAPLADRLGISWVKIELEDLSLQHLQPEMYEQIKLHLAARKTERAEFLEEIKEEITGEAETEGIKIDVTTRAKHYYSIFQKMKRDNKPLEEIYDILGLRILCMTKNQCYTLLGLVHKLWMPIEGRFKDYIAMPKANQYQSLHTTVMCPDGKQIEIQIRTNAMHWTAEYGVAAHWLYKQASSPETINRREVAIINKLKNWSKYKSSSGEFLEEIKRDLLEDSIYVFTPEGDVIELPRGSTPIDFAYHIHTEVGSHCVGAKADGTIIPLNSELNNTQVIEIMTSNKGRPHLNWLRYAKTSRAKSKIRHWLNKHDDSLILEKNIVARKKKEEPLSEARQKRETRAEEPKKEVVKQVIDKSKVYFKIGGEKNMLITIARCCRPSTGDDIIGYISRGRGIIVHKKSCPNLRNIKDFKERSIIVEWEAMSPKHTKRFKVTAHMTSDLFSEIEGAVRKYKGHLIEGKLEENDQGNLTGAFTMELENSGDFKKVIKSIRTVPAVINILPVDAYSLVSY
jgi:GTP diphosphokinase / guanosine-3',5'-bis(diphosphate) 3'-diphosphatase